MTETLKLLAIFAHPDDESMGLGGTLAKYATEGVETYLACATRGERGWGGLPETHPGLDGMGKLREAELLAAARVLGLREVKLLDYIDGDLDQARPAEAIARIVSQVRRVRPQVVVTFGPDGGYGHPDHIAISQFTQAALVCAADANYADPEQLGPQRVSKLYYMVDSESLVQLLKSAIGETEFEVDGIKRTQVAWAEWAITTRIVTADYWQIAWEAIACHQTQLAGMPELKDWSDDLRRRFMELGTFYRAFSLVNGGRRVEADLFEGLR